MLNTHIFQITHLTSPLADVARQWIVPFSGGLIGRAAHCTLVLDDPSRVISREHAQVQIQNHVVLWTELGTNMSTLNGQAFAPGVPSPLKHGDLIRIGDYLLTFQSINSGLEDLPGVANSIAPPEPVSLMLAEKALNIDDLLADLAPPSPPVEEKPESSDAPVLAHRFYVGKREEPSLPLARPSVDLPHEDALKQAQVALGLPPGQTPSGEEINKACQLLRLCIEHCLILLGTRRIYRTETGAQLTTIAAVANNPLKLASSADEVLARLLRPAAQGYMEAEEALQQAFGDILHHMQSSVVDLQKMSTLWRNELSPRAIEQAIQDAGGLTCVVETLRKAKAWELYCERYQDVERQWS